MVIAIDGTSGSGKSSVGRKMAKNLGFTFLSSGSIYRAMALATLQANVPPHQILEIIDLISHKTSIEISVEKGESFIILNGRKVISELRTPEVTAIVSKIAQIPEIRVIAQKLQHQIAQKSKQIVIEGRDIGSVVFPNAEVKIFITADIDIRAERRLNDYIKLGKQLSLEEVKAELTARDQEDTTRKISPLVVPKDAIVLNTSNLNEQQTVTELTKIVLNAINQKHS